AVPIDNTLKNPTITRVWIDTPTIYLSTPTFDMWINGTNLSPLPADTTAWVRLLVNSAAPSFGAVTDVTVTSTSWDGSNLHATINLVGPTTSYDVRVTQANGY